MQDPAARSRNNTQLPLTRNHLYAMGAMSLALALLAFFVGLSLGRGPAAEPAKEEKPLFLSEEARTGDLEVLLAKVEAANGKDAALGFPAELARSEPPPPLADPNAPPPDPAAPPEAGTTEPAAPPTPPPNPFPPEARPGTATLSGPPAAAPLGGDGVPTGGWAVEVGSHAAEADAARSVETLRAAGLAAYRVVALVGGKSVWRVRIGGYRSKEGAAAALPAVASKAGASDAAVTAAP